MFNQCIFHAFCGLTLKVDPFSLSLTSAILSRGCWTSTTVPRLPLATVSSPTTSLQLSSNQFRFEVTLLHYPLVGWSSTRCVQVAVTVGEGGRGWQEVVGRMWVWVSFMHPSGYYLETKIWSYSPITDQEKDGHCHDIMWAWFCNASNVHANSACGCGQGNRVLNPEGFPSLFYSLS